MRADPPARLGTFPVTALHWRSESTAQTLALGRRLGTLLRPGDFVALTGPLGAGKTHLVKGIAAGLEVPPDEPVVSPTFVLVREYAGRLTLYHIDAYRLKDAAELLALGLEEMLADPGGTVALEWADRVSAAVPPQAWGVDMAHAGPDAREITVNGADPERLAALAAVSREP
jgi:tRNA threonylcarbamoyladenosine biosynthesis protein TsaE